MVFFEVIIYLFILNDYDYIFFGVFVKFIEEWFEVVYERMSSLR